MGILAGWRYCPRCGAPLRHDGSKVECGACGLVRYANPVPAVAALVLDGEGRVLLARRAAEPDAGRWDTIGGFLEEHEDALSGLRREVREETSLEVEAGDFVGAVSDRYGDGIEAPTALNLVWEARILRGEPVAADDVAELRWFARDALPTDDELAFRWLAPFLRAWAAGDGGRGNAEGPADRPFD